MTKPKRQTVTLAWVSKEYERKLHKKGFCSWTKCPLLPFRPSSGSPEADGPKLGNPRTGKAE